MKVCGIISEYNPFHNGHLYQVEIARKLTGCDYIVSIMSGNFLQRGCPAIMDKYNRSLMAINAGVDLVLELPNIYAISSAEYFATSACLTLASLGTVDYLCFGAECDDIKLLSLIANTLIKEPESYSDSLSTLIKEGNSFPKARAMALEKYLDNHIVYDVLSKPNNILAIEYIKAINKYNLSLKPLVIKRIEADYHDETLYGNISSATAIRQFILNNSELNSMENDVPASTYNILQENFNKIYPITNTDFTPFLQYALLSCDSLEQYVDINFDLSDRILNSYSSELDFDALSNRVKNKQITKTRVDRCLYHILLKHTHVAFREYIDNGYIYYARILAFKKDSSPLIKAINSSTSIPIINKVASAFNTLSPTGTKMLKQDIYSSNLYNQIVYNKHSSVIKNDYIHPLEIV